LGFARLDTIGCSEKVFQSDLGRGKDLRSDPSIMRQLKNKGHNILITRLDEKKAGDIHRAFRKSQYYPQSRVLTVLNHPVEFVGKGTILIITAGTTDIPVAEEAALTATTHGEPG